MKPYYSALGYFCFLLLCSACVPISNSVEPTSTPLPSLTASPVPTATSLPTSTPTAIPSPTAQPANPLPTQSVVQGPQLPLGASARPFAVVPAHLIKSARQDLAQRLNIASEDIVVKSAWAIMWPNRALGCPRSSQPYPDHATEGVLISLVVEQTDHYYYHGDLETPPFLCEYPQP